MRRTASRRPARQGGLNSQQAAHIRRWWFELVDVYQKGDADLRRNILLKKQHTLRVQREALQLGAALGLSPSALRLVEAIVLLHDVGRFEQYSRYRTFSDPRSTNHARLSLRIIRQHRILADIPPEEKAIIRRAILYHNRASIPTRLPAPIKLHSRLLRDADKLDIWRLVIHYYNAKEGEKNHAISVGFKDTPGFSHEVWTDVCSRRIVQSRHLRNLTDFKLLQLGWVFDLNFSPTFQVVARRRYLEKIRAVLPSTPEMEQAYTIARSHVEAHRGKS